MPSHRNRPSARPYATCSYGLGACRPELPLLAGLDKVPIRESSLEPFVDMKVDAVNLRDSRVVGSYSWLSSEASAIAIPGGAPIWNPPTVIGQIAPDGERDVNNNALMLDGSSVATMDPALRGVHVMRKDLPLHNVDIITDRNNLRKLGGYLSGLLYHKKKAQDFRMGAQIIGKTLLLTRWESRLTEVNPIKCCSQGYIEAATQPQAAIGARPIATYVVVQRKISGLLMLIRLGIDSVSVGHSQAAEDRSHAVDGEGCGVLDQGPAVEANKAGNRLETTPPPPALPYTITRGGRMPQFAEILEIKTRRQGVEYDKADIINQCMWSGAPLVYVGRHDYGYFGENTVDKISLNEMAAAELEQAGDVMGRVGELLKHVGAELAGSGITEPVALVFRWRGKVANAGKGKAMYIHRLDGGEAQTLSEDMSAFLALRSG